jgi:hypothetical protein
MRRKLRLYLPTVALIPMNLVALGTSAFLISNPYTFWPTFLLAFVANKNKYYETISIKRMNVQTSFVPNEKKKFYSLTSEEISAHEKNEEMILHNSYPFANEHIVGCLMMNFLVINQIYLNMLMFWCILLICIDMMAEKYKHESVSTYLRRTIIPATNHLIPFTISKERHY